MKRFKNVLAIAPHPDDVELGCGGTISKLIEEGSNVCYATFSLCKKSVPATFPEDVLMSEMNQATSVLGISKENRRLFDYEVRTFNYYRQNILDDLLKIKKEFNPDLVFIPSIGDIHQDHQTISNEAIRAFKFSSILGYELPWNNFSFNTTAFFSLEPKHIEKKMLALQAYKSQSFRNYMNEDFIKGLAKTRGVQSNNVYAEAFEVKRMCF